MRYPTLVPKRLCKTDIRLEINREGLTEDGELLEPVVYEGKCNYQDRARTVLTAEKKLVEVTGTVLIPGDPCPELPVISGGKAFLCRSGRRPPQGRAARTPDDTVNSAAVQMLG